ncbi:MAG: type II toxin-antitoxin system RelE/ParE family toxin [Candidatus Thiosymbion ectosymbiont of Robbea hypermnestra]|nr:type II toxin-antitoxin system RelE/ParE family toxin [Candidatus Thiosymbion ectosymbiont of Robbea hypermnestra]
MASYSIEWKHSAKKELRKLPDYMIRKVILSIDGLSKNPIPKGSRKILGTEHTYRIRVGDYRIVYSLDSGKLVVEIIRVSHRKNVYKNLA